MGVMGWEGPRGGPATVAAVVMAGWCRGSMAVVPQPGMGMGLEHTQTRRQGL